MGEEPRIIREVEEGDRIYLKGFGSTSTSQAYKNFATTFALNITNALGYDLTQDAVYYEGEFLLSPGCDLEVFRKTKTIRSRKGKTIPVLEVRMIHPGIEFSDAEVLAAVTSGTNNSGGDIETTLRNEEAARNKRDTKKERGEQMARANFLDACRRTDGFVSGPGKQEPTEGQFMYFDDGHEIMTWKQCLMEDQDILFKAFVLDGETQCRARFGIVNKGRPPLHKKTNSPCRQFDSDWGKGYWREIIKSPYNQTGSNDNKWIRPVARAPNHRSICRPGVKW